MPIEIKYTGTQQRWPELATTGKQSVWMPGQIEERDDVEAGKLLATGLFKSEPIPLTATLSAQGVEIKAGDYKIRAAVIDPAKVDTIKSVCFYGDNMFVQLGWDATNDQLMRIRLAVSSDPYANAPVDFLGISTASKSALDAATTPAAISALYGSVVISLQNDAATPFYANGGFIGGNHGAPIAHQITAVAHGKTSADIGSAWSGPSARTFVILRIIDADKLWILSNNANSNVADGAWTNGNFYTGHLTGETLTHSSGAANTASIAVTADAPSTQLTPALNNKSVDIYIGGDRVEPSSTKVFRDVKSLRIVEKYSIVNPSFAYDFMRANAGKSPRYWDNAIQYDMTLTNVYSLSSNGARTSKQTIKVNIPLSSFGFIGGAQENPPNSAGKSLGLFMPGTSAIGAVDYQAVGDITSLGSPVTVTTANWLESDNPPNVMAEIVASTAGTFALNSRIYGSVVAYIPTKGIGTRVKRTALTNISGAILSTTSKKMYPYARTVAPVGTEEFSITSFTHVYNCSNTGDATVSTWAECDGDYLVYVAFHKTSSLHRVLLPPPADGWTARIIDAKSVRLLNDVVIDGGGVAVACDASFGYAWILVTP